jgi:acyl carrier protein
MNIEDIIKEVNKVFIDVLENEDISINYETNARDIDEWDSLNHIMLVVGIESHFSISFTTEEVNGFKNVGQMCESIKEKKSE